jgi:hypothetical protein
MKRTARRAVPTFRLAGTLAPPVEDILRQIDAQLFLDKPFCPAQGQKPETRPQNALFIIIYKAVRVMDYYELFHKEFAKESDRACVIVAGAMLDELLRSLLLAYLVPSTTSDDPLFDTVNAPLATFSARIEIAFRCGIISQRFARDLHLVRKIRNDFAHNIRDCNFDDTRVRSRVLALSRSNSIIH